jgi:heme-degrading monooxygenase HmoA
MGQVYSVGLWTVKPGREDEFVAAWSEFAEWTRREISPTAVGTLLRDRETANRFVSFGPWESEEQMEAWRAHPGFGEQVAGIRELLENFSPGTFEQVAGGA